MEADRRELQPSTSRCDTRWSQELSGLPPKLLQRLMPFQREGVEFALSRNGRCMIADEMGLGKTVQAIAAAYAYRQEWPLLVVAPSSMRYPWVEELEKWIPELQPGDINLVESKSHTMGIGDSKVTVLGYGLLTSDARPLVEALSRRKFAVVVADEAHYLKSRNAARTQILVPLLQGAKRAILLTGTPALGRPEELFMQIDALYPKRFGTWSDYAKKYCNAHYRYFGRRRQWDCRGASNLDELHRRLSQVMIRRLKADVLHQLPPKVRQRIPFQLPREAAKEAASSFAQWEALMRGRGASQEGDPFTEVMTLVTHMYKQTAIAKAGAVKDYIKMMLEAERLKFLVFAHHLTMLQACTEAVIEAKAGYIRIDGSVPSSERIQLVHKFQTDPDTRVAVLSIQAAGQGLTLTAASHVVFAELYWNPGHMKQAEDRAHRIGQTASVNVHYLIAKGTFDTVMWAMLNRKETVTGSTLNGRKAYLEADEGDKDKWEFLSFSEAWAPSESPLSSPLTSPASSVDRVFFTHFEKDKQHDIRSFFSPSVGKDKKRKRTDDEEEDGDGGDGEEPESHCSPPPDSDFSAQVKRLRAPGRGRGQGRGGRGSPSGRPLLPRTPRRLLAPERSALSATAWSCGACTFSNSGLLPFCEMCEQPRPRPPAPPPPTAADKQSKKEEKKEDEETEELEVEMWKGKQEEWREAGAEKKEEEQHKGDDVDVPPVGGAGEHRHEPERGPDDNCNAEGDAHPVYPGLQFCASQHTDRIYLYTKDGSPLNCSFIPLDIKLSNWDELPEAFSQRRENRTQVLGLVQEWSRLTAMKQRLLRRSTLLFCSVAAGLQQLASTQRPHGTTSRFLSRAEVAQASRCRAQQEEGATVRLLTRDSFFSSRKKTSPAAAAPATPSSPPEDTCGESTPPPSDGGYLQAVDSAGVPLCLSCQQACPTTGGPWDTRFCSHRCQEEFQLRSSQSYMRSQVLQAEGGICQHCGLAAHDLFLRVRDAPPAHRKEALESTWLAQLPLKQLNEMIRAPVEGHFWQVDHIRPVYSGGGQCSLDNLQTLCTVCHKARTAQQAKERSQRRKSAAAAKVASDISRFFIRK